jgi:hypothetical protein
MPKTQSIVGGELYPARVLRDNPVAYYRLGDVEGYAQAVLSNACGGFWRLSGGATDSAPAPHNGTVNGTITFGQAGPLSDGTTAALFNGSTGYINVADNATQNPGTGSYSYEAWVKRAAGISASEFVICKASGAGVNTGGGELFINSSGAFVSRLGAKTVGQDVGGFADGQWHHVVVSMNRAVSNGGQMYVDGVATGVAVDLTTEAAVNLSGNAQDFLIGKRPTGNFFNGAIGNVSIYTYALSAVQAANLYALRTSTIATVAAATVADASGNARTGTIAGGVTLQQAGSLADGNTAARFDGAATTVVNTFSDAATVVPTTAWTLEAWFKQGGTSGGVLITRANSRPSLLMNGGAASLLVVDASSVQVSIFYGVSLLDGQWHHLAGTYDGTSLRLYVDGVLRAGPTACNAYGVLGSQVWRIGGRSDGIIPCDGSIDEAAIYAYALTDEQVAAHYFNRLAVPSGLRASGAAPFAFKRATVGAGGVGVSGTATWRRGRVRLGSGGLRIGGVSPTAHAKAFHPVYAARVVDVVDESRTVVVPTESRIVVVPFESRVDAVPAEV